MDSLLDKVIQYIRHAARHNSSRMVVELDILHKKFNTKWGIDRGKNPPNSHWGDIRDNDRHLSLEAKRAASENR